jgi:UDP-glucuronate decarboxylase
VQALRGEPLTIYGSGEQTRSFCYVSDLVAGLIALMETPNNPGAPVNLGNPGEFTILELAEMVVSATGSGSQITHRPLPADDPQRRRPDITRARQLLDWSPRVALSEGLPHTIQWFASDLDSAVSPALMQRKSVPAGGSRERASRI